MEWEKSEALTKSEKPTETEVVAEVYISHLKGQESLTAFRQCWPDLSPTPSISSSGFSLDQISGVFYFMQTPLLKHRMKHSLYQWKNYSWDILDLSSSLTRFPHQRGEPRKIMLLFQLFKSQKIQILPQFTFSLQIL